MEKANQTIEFYIIQVRQGTKFYFKQTIWNFWIRFAQKLHFWSKTEESHFCVRLWSLITVTLFHMRADRHNSILMTLLLLVVKAKKLILLVI